MTGGSEMRDWDFVPRGYPEFTSHSDFPRLADGFSVCGGGCGRLTLDRFCRDCARLNLQMEAKRIADGQRTKLYARMERENVGVVELPVPHKLPFENNPVGLAVFGLAVLSSVALVFWYGPRLLAGFGLWLSAN